MMTAEQAMESSRSQDRIVTIPHTPEAEQTLRAACSDWTRNGSVTEFWADDPEQPDTAGRMDWRVHLVRETTHCTGCGDEIPAASAHWHGEERYCDGCEAAPSEEE